MQYKREIWSVLKDEEMNLLFVRQRHQSDEDCKVYVLVGTYAAHTHTILYISMVKIPWLSR